MNVKELSYLVAQFLILAMEGREWHALLCICHIYILLVQNFPMGKSLSSLQFFWIKLTIMQVLHG